MWLNSRSPERDTSVENRTNFNTNFISSADRVDEPKPPRKATQPAEDQNQKGLAMQNSLKKLNSDLQNNQLVGQEVSLK